ncbi:BRO family protein [Clostridium sp. Ade.TY]|uniref:BRO-N domain-containing protein n=1 Tax=Clostridium sp. Ade.TY TaxID=1391647 RepID=UPI0024186E90|nr:BRO family protein [Clostridium sp. Ade.TY]
MRVLTLNNEPWFIGKDVAEKLGYKNTAKAIRDHVDNEDKLGERIVLAGQRREVIVINESGLYSLILSSKLPKAKEFKRWITNEILPSIRKHGAYMTEDTIQKALTKR